MDVNKKRILFLSNGNGEDSIASAIVAKLPAELLVEAYPLIGAGNAYKNICEIVGPRMYIPSEGHRQAGSIAKDIKGGMIAGTWKAIGFLRSLKGKYDKIIAVGDAVTPILCGLAGLKIDIYLDVYKNGYAHKYSAFETWMIKRSCKKTYCRDDILASSLRQVGIDATSKGNIMLDTITSGAYDMAAHRSKPMVATLLPGSRQTAAENFSLQVEALKMLPAKLLPDIFVAVAGGVLIEDLAASAGMQHHGPGTATQSDLGYLTNGALVLHLTSDILENLITISDIVLSQAGTATQQALGMAKPVITFIHADYREKRINDEQTLMGEARILVPQDAKALAEAVASLLSDKHERKRLGEIGKTRLGGPGTLEAVVGDIVS